VDDDNDSQVDEEDQENLQQMAVLLAQQQDDNNDNNLMMRRRQRRDNNDDNDEWREAKNNNNDDDSDIKEEDDAKLEDGTPTAAVDDDGTAMYDFDYNDSSASVAGDGDDAVYYSLAETAPAAESLFDRRERLDVKKPGPFFTNSQNNFFLDKVRKCVVF
jgi:hypothetical protein